MKTLIVFIVYMFFVQVGFSQDQYEKEIMHVLSEQAKAWNKGNIEEYMNIGYWDNDSLVFIGKSGPVYGFAPTLERYKKSYSDIEKMGTLSFTNIQVKKLSNVYCFVTGGWALKRKAGDLSGYFTLLFKKMNGHWMIIADHSS